MPTYNFLFMLTGLHLSDVPVGYQPPRGPAINFHLDPAHARGVAPQQVELFMVFYFIMTLIHAIHMIIGVGLLAWLIRPSLRGRFDANNHNYVEGIGLYWHFVDIVWIFLFPLLYLVGRHG